AEGAFTGAKRGGHPGKFEIADKGTIFLDEIGEMPLEMQIRLLRVIEEGTVMRVGDSREIPVDVRVIAATNKELKSEVQAGRFRMDLFYRLNVLPIRLPPLRERPGDIPLLVEYYMRKASRKLNKKPVELPPGYLDRLTHLEWSGNIRELENHIEFLIMSEGLPSEGLHGDRTEADTVEASGASLASAPSLEAAEQTLIRATLLECGNNVTQSARRLGIGRNTLYRKIQRYQIDCSIMGR
ncbi:MAG: sigma 54-interacting transcriptional regulator, partial [Rectinemataceae bacterium]